MSANQKQSRLKRTIIILCTLIGLIIIVGIFSFYTAGNYAYKALFKSMMMQDITETLGTEVVNTKLTEGQLKQLDTILNGENLITAPIAPDSTPSQNTSEPKSEEAGASNSKSKSTSVKQNDTINQNQTIEEAVDAKVNSMISSIPKKDKNAMMRLIIGNINHNDLGYLVGLVMDGISEQDIKDAKQVAIRSFTPDQLEQVKQYYKQYSGLVLK